LTALGELVGVRETLEKMLARLERADEWGAIDAIARLAWSAGGAADFNERGNFRSVIVVNENNFSITVGLAPGAGARAGQPETLTLPAQGWLVLPARGTTISVGAAQAGNASVIPLAVTMPFAMGTLVTGGTAANPSIADVNDRVARALGRVSTGIADTVFGSGSTAAAPPANTNIATIAAGVLPAGVYLVRAFVWQSGAPDANLLNARLLTGGINLGNFPTLTTPQQVQWDRITLTGSQALNINTGPAAGGAGAIYNGFVEATRIE
jgi:hypothetical protein